MVTNAKFGGAFFGVQLTSICAGLLCRIFQADFRYSKQLIDQKVYCTYRRDILI